MKVDITDIEHILNKHNVDRTVINAVVEDAKQAVEDAKADDGAEGQKKGKYKHLIVVSDPDNRCPDISELSMWILKVKEEENHTDVLPRLYKGVYDYNEKSRKGRKNPVKTLGDAMQTVGPKFYKPAKSPILTKEPVIVLVSDNTIPTA